MVEGAVVVMSNGVSLVPTQEFLRDCIQTYLWRTEVKRSDFGICLNILLGMGLITKTKYEEIWDAINDIMPAPDDEPDGF